MNRWVSLKPLPLWPVLFVFGAAFFLRLFFAPNVGPFPKDFELFLETGRYGAEHGVSKLPDLYAERKWDVSYPPLLNYQMVAVTKIGANRVAALEKQYPYVAETWARVRHKSLPILYDMLTGLLILLLLVRLVAPPWPLLGAIFYLFNPCIFIDSAIWGHLDAIHSFFIALVVLCLGLACDPQRDRWLVGAWLMFALATCAKLQSIVMFPPLAIMKLMRRSIPVTAAGVAEFLATVAACYSPFLIAQRWDYFQSVFVSSFTWTPFTHLNAFNFWGLGYVVPSTNKILGIISYVRIGQLAYIAAVLWLCFWLAKCGIARADRKEAMRKLFVAGAFASIAPFMLLTQMRERYIVPAMALLVISACLDPRLRALLAGYSLTYTLNLLYVQHHVEAVGASAGDLAVVNAECFAIRMFGCLLNVAMFCWFTARLPGLLGEQPPPREQAAA